MTPVSPDVLDYAHRLIARLQALGAPVTGSFWFGGDQLAIDYWLDDGAVRSLVVSFTPDVDFTTLPLPQIEARPR